MTSNRLSPDKEINKIVKEAKRQGWRVEKTKNSHILFYPPDSSDGFVTLPSTPSSVRNFKNHLRRLRSMGLKI